MPALQFVAIPTDQVDAYRSGGPDVNGQAPERHISDGAGNPCRHCLTDIAKDDAFLILSYRPFDNVQPYAEQGPIFLHAKNCPHYSNADEMPAMFEARENFLMRGYNAENRIIYGTGKIIPTADLEAAATELLENPDVSFIHLRSASNNCFQCRIERGRA